MTTVKPVELIAKLKAGAKIPNGALRCTAADPIANLEGAPTDAKSIKVHLKARTRDSINHWFFGETYHDFSTAKLPEKVALDDSHGTEVGYARPSLTEYGLELSGVVITNPENPAHESNRVAYNLRNAIPQQASIDFSGDYALQFVPGNSKFTVNGAERTAGMDGAIVIQNWTLRACAICKEGADPTTETTTFTNGDFAPSPTSITEFSAEPQGVEAKPAETATAVVDANPAPALQLAEVATELDATKTSLAVKVTEIEQLQAEIAKLKAQIVTLSAGVAPVPVTLKPELQSWGEALAAVQSEHPNWQDWQVHAEAVKRFPALLAKINAVKK